MATGTGVRNGAAAKPVVSFGEAMLRLTPPRHEPLERALSLDISPGGAELNSAVTAAALGVPAVWVSCLPENPLGRNLARQALASGVDLSRVRWIPDEDGRMGLYFLEEGADPRPSAVTYDRAASAFARIAPGAFDWEAILAEAGALHISGITPAVGEGPRAETGAAIRAANKLGVPVAFDLNYRSKLWSEAEARACFVEVVPQVDILFASRSGLRTFFGLDGTYEEVLTQAHERLGLATTVLSRKKGKTSREVRLGSVAMGQDGQVIEGPWRSVEVVDRLGGGDAFAGAFLAGYVRHPEDLARCVALGGAAQALKHTMHGDFLIATREQIEAAVADTEGGVLQR
ncbi:MAG TPA: sugar kinase [Thermomicrobiales bacterium]|nr:sugar kinase [Thermomicrobiales bacterium]